MSGNVLSERLKYLRDKNGFLQKYVADKLEIRSNTLSGYENGTRSPDPVLLNDLANFYDVTSDYLLGRTDNPHQSKEDDQDEKTAIINKIARDFPDADLMFHDMANMDSEQLQEVYEFIKFKMQQKKNNE